MNGESSNSWNGASYSNTSQDSSSNSISCGKVNNINLAPKVMLNGDGDLSPRNSSHGEGSPLRSNLALKLKNAQPALLCPMCQYTSNSPGDLEEHINRYTIVFCLWRTKMATIVFRRHFDLTSPSVGGCTSEVYACPLCVKGFNSAPDLELHVNIEHRDILSPASPSSHSCPVCGIALTNDNNVNNLLVKPVTCRSQ